MSSESLRPAADSVKPSGTRDRGPALVWAASVVLSERRGARERGDRAEEADLWRAVLAERPGDREALARLQRC